MAKKILVETSARHVHLSDEHLKVLFGADAVLHKKKDLSQPGQFACEERVDVVGPKKTLARVSVLGPTRKQTQVELSMTDAVPSVLMLRSVSPVCWKVLLAASW